jgi:hypothetical protein|tara:strand:+ start:572 stop:724 length:153 start_codon:yes stop_codon:yes gene_type:complete
MKKKKSSTKKRTINLGSNYINFLTAVEKYRHLPYDQYKKKIAEELGYIKK